MLFVILTKRIFLIFLLIIGYTRQVNCACISPFTEGDERSVCYSYVESSVSWSDGYNRCLDENIKGILLKISSIEQFHALKKLHLTQQGSFWLGANNFASFLDSQWHWLDGSIVESSVLTWCPNSTHETAIGTQCAAYDSTLDCVTNYVCNTLLPAPCVAATNLQPKTSLSARLFSIGTCTNAYGGAYANWWIYAMLLLNWFGLLCFTLYITSRLDLNTGMIILTVACIIISFLIIMAFAVLWGVQYQEILKIPLAIVVVGWMAILLLLIDILVLVSNRTRVFRWKACMIVTIITIIVECGLMFGAVFCIANCSGYVSMPSTTVDKDVIAALLASLATAISIMFYNGIVYLLGYAGQDRIYASGSTQPNLSPIGQGIVPRRSQVNNSAPSRADGRHDKVERATSPVDQRIINEFYSDQPMNMHQYQLDGRQYIVYEGHSFADIEPYRRDLTQATLSQESQGLRDSIARVRNSPHATALADEIQHAEDLLNRLK